MLEHIFQKRILHYNRIQLKNNVRRPEIEPGSQEWESCMIPLHQRRFTSTLGCTQSMFWWFDCFGTESEDESADFFIFFDRARNWLSLILYTTVSYLVFTPIKDYNVIVFMLARVNYRIISFSYSTSSRYKSLLLDRISQWLICSRLGGVLNWYCMVH